MLDLTGITNENEFYTHHYLKEWAKAEKEDGARAPYSLLSGSSKKFFLLRSQFRNEKDSAKQATLQREVTRLLLEPIKYIEQSEEIVLAEGETLPVFAKINKPNGTPELIVCEVLEDEDETDPLNVVDYSAAEYQGERVRLVTSLNEYSLSSDEGRTLNQIRKAFRDFGAGKIAEFSHSINGWQETTNAPLISYEFVDSLE